FVLVTHINPDGDAVGSEWALASYLLDQGKRVRIVNQDRAPESMRFVGFDRVPIEIYDAATHDSLIASAGRILLVDNSAPDRLGRMERVMRASAARTLCIDHHPTRDAPWADSIVDVHYCATTAMIYDLARGVGWAPDEVAALAIYVGIATDTGFFRFNSTNPRAHRIAAELIDLGVDPARVYREIYERNSVSYVRLLGHALTDLRMDAGGAIASVRIARELIERLDAEEVDVTEITTSLLALDGVRVAVLYRELADGRVKVSLRSKGTLDVHRLAIEFGGGGHRNASGIVMDGGLDRSMRIVTGRVAAMVAATDQGPARAER
ncbi:MAG TPA: bifunctional oligoribonuclease/PAP phosphatase NrnA, partial [Candidatus Polarisedimenticolaceae bacterium]|nr:bifunctional oligoribonuclease/PAP phosphatase NrnA [Candidatus Polarisedimenticolaceae bacterium]